MTQLLIIIFMVLLTPACGAPQVSEPPPADGSEGIVEAAQGRASGELVAEPDEIAPDGRVVLRVVNHGERMLSYGRPITVERWQKEQWEETEESRNTAWTMELLLLAPGKAGVEQTWPFLADQRPEPGWYRFTKVLQSEGGDDVVRLTVRTRILVTE